MNKKIRKTIIIIITTLVLCTTLFVFNYRNTKKTQKQDNETNLIDTNDNQKENSDSDKTSSNNENINESSSDLKIQTQQLNIIKNNNKSSYIPSNPGTDTDETDPVETDSIKDVELPRIDILSIVFANGPLFLEEPKDQIKDVSVTLGSEIGLNFYVEVHNIELSNTMAYSVTGKGDITGTQNLSEAEKQDDGTYKFTAYLNVLQMADLVTASFTYGENTLTNTISVLDYLNALVEQYGQSRTTKDKATVGVAKAMADYGYFAQQYLKGVRGFKLSSLPEAKPTNAYTEITRIDNSEIEILADSANVYALQNVNELNFNYSLRLDSKTSIVLMIQGAKPPKSVMYRMGEAGEPLKTLDIQEQNGSYQAIIENISAHQLGEFIMVIVDDGNEIKAIKISALSYANSVLQSDSTSIEQKQCVASLLDYFKAVDKYRIGNERHNPQLNVDNNDIPLAANSYIVSRPVTTASGVPTPQVEVISTDYSNHVEAEIDEMSYLNVKGLSEGSALVRVFTPGNNEYLPFETIIKVRITENPSITYDFTCDVVDSYLETTIEGATITFGGITKISDQNGQAIFTDIIPSTYQLEVSYDEYKTHIENVTIETDQGSEILLRKWIRVAIQVTEGGVLYDYTGTPVCYPGNTYYTYVPSGTKTGSTLKIINPFANTDPTLTFTDPDDGSNINFYTRRTSDLYIYDNWYNENPGVPIVKEPEKPIIAGWKIDLEWIRPLRFQDSDGNEFVYHPICDGDHPIREDFTFFGEREEGKKDSIYIIEKSGTDVKAYTMEDLKEARWYSLNYGGTFTAVRSINGVSYNDIYGDGGSGSKEVSEDWINSNLLKDESGKIVEKVETIYNGSLPTEDYKPIINGIEIEKIFRMWNNLNGFSTNGKFWSCVADSDIEAYQYDCNLDNLKYWWLFDRDMKDNVDVLISRELGH